MDFRLIEADVHALGSFVHRHAAYVEEACHSDSEMLEFLEREYSNANQLQVPRLMRAQFDDTFAAKVTALADQGHALGPDRVQHFVRDAVQHLSNTEEFQRLQSKLQQDVQEGLQNLTIDPDLEGDCGLLCSPVHDEGGTEGRDDDVQILKFDSADESDGGNSWGGASFHGPQLEACIAQLESPTTRMEALVELKKAAVDDLCDVSCWDQLCQGLRQCLQDAQQQVTQDAIHLVVALMKAVKIDSPLQSAQLLALLLEHALTTLRLELHIPDRIRCSFESMKEIIQQHAWFEALDVCLAVLSTLANDWHFLPDSVQDDVSTQLSVLLHASISHQGAAASCPAPNTVALSAMAALLLLEPGMDWWQQLWATSSVSIKLAAHCKVLKLVDLAQQDLQAHSSPLSLPRQLTSQQRSRPHSAVRPRSHSRPNSAQRANTQFQQQSPSHKPVTPHTTLPALHQQQQMYMGQRPYTTQHHQQQQQWQQQQQQQEQQQWQHPQQQQQRQQQPQQQQQQQQQQQHQWQQQQQQQQWQQEQQQQQRQRQQQLQQQQQQQRQQQPQQQQQSPQHQPHQYQQQPSPQSFQQHQHPSARPPSPLRNQQRKQMQQQSEIDVNIVNQVYHTLLAAATAPLLTSASARRCLAHEVSRPGNNSKAGQGGSELETVLCWHIHCVLDGRAHPPAVHISQQALLACTDQEASIFTRQTITWLLQPLQAMASSKMLMPQFEKLLEATHLAGEILHRVASSPGGRAIFLQTDKTRFGEPVIQIMLTAAQWLANPRQQGWRDTLTVDTSAVLAVYAGIVSTLQMSVSDTGIANSVMRFAESFARVCRQKLQGQDQARTFLFAALLKLCCAPRTVTVLTSMPDLLRVCCDWLAGTYYTGNLQTKQDIAMLASCIALTPAGCSALVKSGFIEVLLRCIEETLISKELCSDILHCSPCSHPQLKLLQYAKQLFAVPHLIQCLQLEPPSGQSKVLQVLQSWITFPSNGEGLLQASEKLHVFLRIIPPLLKLTGTLQQLEQLIDLRKLLLPWLSPLNSEDGTHSSIVLNGWSAGSFIEDINTAAIVQVLRAMTIPFDDLEDTGPRNGSNDSNNHHLKLGTTCQASTATMLSDDANSTDEPTEASALEAVVCCAPGMRDGPAWLERLQQALSHELSSDGELPYHTLAIMLQRTVMVALRGAHGKHFSSSHWDHSHKPDWVQLRPSWAQGEQSLAATEGVAAAVVWGLRGGTGPEASEPETTPNAPERPTVMSQEAASLSRLLSSCWPAKDGVLSHHPDFFIGLVWEIMGATQITAEFLCLLSCSRAAQYWWHQWGSSVGGSGPTLRCATAALAALHLEEPALASLMEQAGVGLAQVVSRWLLQSFVSIIPTTEAVKVLCASVVLGPDYLVYTAVALLQHLHNRWRELHVLHELADRVWLDSAPDFALSMWFPAMQELQQKYRPMVLEMLEL